MVDERNWPGWDESENRRLINFREYPWLLGAARVRRVEQASGVLQVALRNLGLTEQSVDILTGETARWIGNHRGVRGPTLPLSESLEFEEEFEIVQPGPLLFEIKAASNAVVLLFDDIGDSTLSWHEKNIAEICRIWAPDFAEINRELIEYLSSHPQQLYELNPRALEKLLAEIFANQGYRSELGPGWSDRGVDIRLYQKDTIGELLTLVQVKRYGPKYAIRLEAVAALSAVVDDEGANRGLFVTTSRFLPSARRFAMRRSRRLALADSGDIAKWCRDLARAWSRARQ